MTPQEKKEINDFIEEMDGLAWKGLVNAQYGKSRQEKRTHEEAMADVSALIIKTANKVLEGKPG